MSAETADRLAAVRERIANAAARAGRHPDEITLVGVSKRKSADDIVQAVCAGLRHVGENYMQEARAKIPAVVETLAVSDVDPPCWHFIGRLQSNKANRAVELFDVIETLDRPSLGEHLNRRAWGKERPLDVLVEVNLSDEPQKAGVSPEGLPDLLAQSAGWRHLRLAGLMAIPEASDDPEQVRPAFARLRELRDTLRAGPGCESLTELSMGMSADFEVAIEEGATLVRVGTAIFGARE
jgi:pyridoxal phosphate enzyme (YggS family)